MSDEKELTTSGAEIYTGLSSDPHSREYPIYIKEAKEEVNDSTYLKDPLKFDKPIDIQDLSGGTGATEIPKDTPKDTSEEISETDTGHPILIESTKILVRKYRVGYLSTK